MGATKSKKMKPKENKEGVEGGLLTCKIVAFRASIHCQGCQKIKPIKLCVRNCFG